MSSVLTLSVLLFLPFHGLAQAQLEPFEVARNCTGGSEPQCASFTTYNSCAANQNSGLWRFPTPPVGVCSNNKLLLAWDLSDCPDGSEDQCVRGACQRRTMTCTQTSQFDVCNNAGNLTVSLPVPSNSTCQQFVDSQGFVQSSGTSSSGDSAPSSGADPNSQSGSGGDSGPPNESANGGSPNKRVRVPRGFCMRVAYADVSRRLRSPSKLERKHIVSKQRSVLKMKHEGRLAHSRPQDGGEDNDVESVGHVIFADQESENSSCRCFH